MLSAGPGRRRAVGRLVHPEDGHQPADEQQHTAEHERAAEAQTANAHPADHRANRVANLDRGRDQAEGKANIAGGRGRGDQRRGSGL